MTITADKPTEQLPAPVADVAAISDPAERAARASDLIREATAAAEGARRRRNTAGLKLWIPWQLQQQRRRIISNLRGVPDAENLRAKLTAKKPLTRAEEKTLAAKLRTLAGRATDDREKKKLTEQARYVPALNSMIRTAPDLLGAGWTPRRCYEAMDVSCVMFNRLCAAAPPLDDPIFHRTGDPEVEVAAAAADVRRHNEVQAAAQTVRDEAIAELVIDGGWRNRQLVDLTGLTSARIAQLRNPHERAPRR